MKPLLTILFAVFLIVGCGQTSYNSKSNQNSMTEKKNESNIQQVNRKSYSVNCSTWDCLEKNKNKDATIKGVFRKYTPNKTGKGANYMFWDWEIMLTDSFAVPVKSTLNEINYKYFDGKKVLIKGTIFYGIIIGSADGQNATGFRIDPAEIKEAEK
jgi:uncharacterized protein YcfL